MPTKLMQMIPAIFVERTRTVPDHLIALNCIVVGSLLKQFKDMSYHLYVYYYTMYLLK